MNRLTPLPHPERLSKARKAVAAVVLVEAGLLLKVQDLWSEVLLFSCLYGEVLPSEKPAKTQNNPVKTTKNEELNGVIPGGNERTGESRFMKVNTIWDDRNVGNQGVDKATFKNTAKQLVQVWTLSQSHQELYDYDAAGNRNELTVNGTAQTYVFYQNAAEGNLPWLAWDQKWFYQYDNNGNLITKAKTATVNYTTRAFVTDTTQEYWNYSWDLKNRLSSVSKNGALVTSYSYDANNLRVARTKGAETTVYAYGRNGALTYQKNLATGKARTYAYLGSEVVGWTDTASDGTQTKMWALTDQLGSVTKVTNASAEVVWSSEYNPFGKTAGIEGLYDFDGSYAGHQPDNDVGLIYAWNRWQDPETGRFISEDPARAGSNWYRYAQSNPLRYTDPTGLMTPEEYARTFAKQAGYDLNVSDSGITSTASSPTKSAGPTPPMTSPVDPRILAAVSEHVYNVWEGKKNGRSLPSGVILANDKARELRMELYNEATGYEAALYLDTNTGNYILAFAGTYPEDSKGRDMDTNLKQGGGNYSDAYNSAMADASILASSGLNGELTGHSLGGGEAAAASMVTGLRATTFNAAGVNPATVNRFSNSQGAYTDEGITNYRVEGEFLTGLQESSIVAGLMPNAAGRQVDLGGGSIWRTHSGLTPSATVSSSGQQFVGLAWNYERTMGEGVRRHSDFDFMIRRLGEIQK